MLSTEPWAMLPTCRMLMGGFCHDLACHLFDSGLAIIVVMFE
jgi:hypothetical protein